ncbi:MAG TPA: hypothetical protein V6C81_13190 [Planktothrix sp.]|jgi:hypothetical protein
MFLAFVLSFIIGRFFAKLAEPFGIHHVIVGWVMIICAIVSAACGLSSGNLEGALWLGVGTGTVVFLTTGQQRRRAMKNCMQFADAADRAVLRRGR